MDQPLDARSACEPASEGLTSQQLRARLLAAEQLERAVLQHEQLVKANTAADRAQVSGPRSASWRPEQASWRRCVAYAEAHRIVRTRPDWSVRIADLLTQVQASGR